MRDVGSEDNEETEALGPVYGEREAREEVRSNWSLSSSLAQHYPNRWLRNYVRWKIRFDPVYVTVADRLGSAERPVLDIGCGIGILPFYLRERGHRAPITGLELDREKIGYAIQVGRKAYPSVEFRDERVRSIEGYDGDVVVLDVVHYLSADSRDELLRSIANSLKPARRLLLRTPLAPGGWRSVVTGLGERMASLLGWNRMPTVDFPTREELDRWFPPSLYSRTEAPLWGITPFGGVLLEYQRLS